METNSQRERSQNCRLCWVPNTTHITLIPGNSHRLASRSLISSLDFTGILFFSHRKTLKMNCNSCVTVAVFNFSLKRKCSETYQIETEAVFFSVSEAHPVQFIFFLFFFNKQACSHVPISRRTAHAGGRWRVRGGGKPLRLTP